MREANPDYGIKASFGEPFVQLALGLAVIVAVLALVGGT